jgi:YD repeat-containing protein
MTDSRDNVKYYDAMGRTTARSTTNGNTTTVYDQMGRQTGSIRNR